MESNIYLINLDFDSFQIERTPYSEDKLQELRSEHNETHSFFRNGDFIYISNKDDETDRLYVLTPTALSGQPRLLLKVTKKGNVNKC